MKTVVFTRNRQRCWRVDRGALVRLATQTLAYLDSSLDALGLIFVNDAQMAQYNAQFHHRDGTTDILTFGYDRRGELIISTEQAVANARRFRTTPQRELALYVVHGLLHLHGYNDQTTAERRRMRAAERRLLRRAVCSGTIPRG